MPQPPDARFMHHTHPTHGSRTFPPPCTALAPLACLAVTLLTSALMCAGAQVSPSTSSRVEGVAPRRRSSGGAARVGREGEESEESEGGGGADIVCVVGYPRISQDIPEFKILGYPRIFWDSLVLPSLGDCC